MYRCVFLQMLRPSTDHFFLHMKRVLVMDNQGTSVLGVTEI